MEENLKLAQEVLGLLSLDKLRFFGEHANLSSQLQSKVRVVKGMAALGETIQSDVGYSALESILEQYQSQAYVPLFADKTMTSELKAMEKTIMSFPWSTVIGSNLDVGEDIEAQLMAFMAVRLAYGKSNEFVEECVAIFRADLWPFGWDAENQKYLAFCSVINS